MAKKKVEKLKKKDISPEAMDDARRELNLISVRTSDLKTQNEHYASETDELVEKFEEASALAKNMEANIKNLRKEEEKLLDSLDGRKSEILQAENLRNTVSTEAGELRTETIEFREEKEKLEVAIALLKEDKEGRVKEIAEREKKVAAKEVLLLEFDEELNVRDALISRREERVALKTKAGLK